MEKNGKYPVCQHRVKCSSIHVANTSKITFIYALICFHYCSNKICVCIKKICVSVFMSVCNGRFVHMTRTQAICLYVNLCLCRQTCVSVFEAMHPSQIYVCLFVYSKNLQMCIQIYMSTEIVSLRYTKVLTYNWIHRGFVSLSSGSFLTCDLLYTLCVGDL